MPNGRRRCRAEACWPRYASATPAGSPCSRPSTAGLYGSLNRSPWPRGRGAGSKRLWPSTTARLLSMPWWSWILIWTTLLAVSLLFYVLLGVRLFRKFRQTLRELGEAADRFGPPSPAAAAYGSGPGAERGAGRHPEDGKLSGDLGQQSRLLPGSAVFVPAAQMRHQYAASKAARRELRRRRRVQRKTERGQP